MKNSKRRKRDLRLAASQVQAGADVLATAAQLKEFLDLLNNPTQGEEKHER